MDSSLTISALISWGDAYKTNEAKELGSRPLLRVVDYKGKAFLEVHTSSTHWERACEWILSIFGIGDLALARVVLVAGKALSQSGQTLSQAQRISLDFAIRLINEKAIRYNARRFLGLFPMTRSAISSPLSFPKGALLLSKKKPSVERRQVLSKKLKKIRPAVQQKEPKHPRIKKNHFARPLPKELPILRQFLAQETQKKKRVVPSLQKIEPKLAAVVEPKRCGIRNEGNTCFAAATLQALFPLRPEINHEGLRSFCNSLSGSENAREGIQGLLMRLSNNSWRYIEDEEGDPVTFLEMALIGHMKDELRWTRGGREESDPAILHQKIQSLPAGATMQDVVNGAFLKRPLVLAIPSPQAFVVSLEGRKGNDEVYNDQPVKINDHLTVSLEGEKRASYRLASVVMYAKHHYYALVPEFDDKGRVVFWTEFNDSTVSRRPNTPDLQQRLAGYGYLFFYTSRE